MYNTAREGNVAAKIIATSVFREIMNDPEKKIKNRMSASFNYSHQPFKIKCYIMEIYSLLSHIYPCMPCVTLTKCYLNKLQDRQAS